MIRESIGTASTATSARRELGALCGALSLELHAIDERLRAVDAATAATRSRDVAARTASAADDVAAASGDDAARAPPLRSELAARRRRRRRGPNTLSNHL